MQSVAIVGVGLIGASFGLALRKAGFAGEITGVSSAPAIAEGLERGAISREATLQEAAAQADLIYLAQPVDRILLTIAELGPLARAGCLITDAGSTKTEIVDQARKSIKLATFLGGHPLAGKEQRGAGAADADLFRGRPYVLTPTHPESSSTLEFRDWLARIGAAVIDISAEEHDHTVALTSHLPQLVSTALALTLARHQSESIEKIFGPGLLDMTRLALSAPDLWASILSTNKLQVLQALDEFANSIQQIREAVESAEVSRTFNAAFTFSSNIRKIRLKQN
jgi:prephenate dehydrogenase